MYGIKKQGILEKYSLVRHGYQPFISYTFSSLTNIVAAKFWVTEELVNTYKDYN